MGKQGNEKITRKQKERNGSRNTPNPLTFKMADLMPPQNNRPIKPQAPNPQPQHRPHPDAILREDPVRIALGELVRGVEHWVNTLGEDCFDLLTRAELDAFGSRLFGIAALVVPRAVLPLRPGSMSAEGALSLLRIRSKLVTTAVTRFNLDADQYQQELAAHAARSGAVTREFKARLRVLDPTMAQSSETAPAPQGAEGQVTPVIQPTEDQSPEPEAPQPPEGGDVTTTQ
jgi:hypothetical protein